MVSPKGSSLFSSFSFSSMRSLTRLLCSSWIRCSRAASSFAFFSRRRAPLLGFAESKLLDMETPAMALTRLSRLPFSELPEGLYPKEASSAACFASNSADRRAISSSTCFFLAFCSALLPLAAAFFRLVSLSWSLDFSFLFQTH